MSQVVAEATSTVTVMPSQMISSSATLPINSRRVAGNDRPWRNIPRHNRAGANKSILADGYAGAEDAAAPDAAARRSRGAWRSNVLDGRR